MMRALIDRHHSDLFYSLQLLFEDRLDIQVWTPVGREWWDQGIWRFGHGYGDERLVEQYLALPGPWSDMHDGTWLTVDPHHPERPIRGVEHRVASDEAWDFVVATVDDNEHGFAEYARKVGARYVRQVGNTRAIVDWRLDPLALVSSEVPIHGRGIVYHQEFDDRNLFAWHPIDLPGAVRSFVNLFAHTPCYGSWSEAKALAPEFTWLEHGHQGRDGFLSPVERVAQAMDRTGWGWHDKIQGDGFGHTLHQWASMGRPLVGHANHYRGQMGEALWVDGETCIDLDKHSVPEAVEMMREVSRSPVRMGMMSEAIHMKYRSLVDFDQEEVAIRELLGLPEARI